jgi:hypothetical protein
MKLAGSTGVAGVVGVEPVAGIAVSPPPLVRPGRELLGAVGAVTGPVVTLVPVVAPLVGLLAPVDAGGVFDEDVGALVTVNPVVFIRPSGPAGPTTTQ